MAMMLPCLLAGIEATKLVTEREIAGAAEHIPKSIDVLLELPRFARGGPSDSRDEVIFRWWALNVYVNAGHTSWALYELWRSGLYLEATILLRNLVEGLVQLRYFESRFPEMLVMLEVAPGRRPKFKEMFDAVAPGYHDKWYGLLSNIAHARVGAAIFRVDEARVAVGSRYDENLTSVVMNQFDPVILGLLRSFPRHFPGYVTSADHELESRRTAQVEWLQRAFDRQMEQFPRSKEWADVVRPLIESV
jgi:hypothetical protein